MCRLVNIFIIFLFSLISCKAQTIISLEQASQYKKNQSVGIPETVTYVKDLNNKLDQYVGVWKGAYNGNSYEIKFIKRVNTKYSVAWDEIIAKMLIKDGKGSIIYNSMDNPDDNTFFSGIDIQGRVYVLYFAHDSQCNGGGNVYIEIAKADSKKMYLYFSRDYDMYDPAKCPNYDTYVPLLPKDKMVLTKQ